MRLSVIWVDRSICFMEVGFDRNFARLLLLSHMSIDVVGKASSAPCRRPLAV